MTWLGMTSTVASVAVSTVVDGVRVLADALPLRGFATLSDLAVGQTPGAVKGHPALAPDQAPSMPPAASRDRLAIKR